MENADPPALPTGTKDTQSEAEANLTLEEYQALRNICEYIYRITGNLIPENREIFALTHLNHLARKFNVSSLHELFTCIQIDQSIRLETVDKLTVHETSFMRNSENFDLLTSELLPELRNRRNERRPVRIWCTPCSSGQEAISIAITLLKTGIESAGKTFQISASDISPKMIKICNSGHYTAFDVSRGIPENDISLWFTKTETGYKTRPEIQSSIHWFQHNLMGDIPAFGFQDIMYCRNFWYYLSKEARAVVARNLSTVLAPDGYLVVSSSETLDGLEMIFARSKIGHNVYRHADYRERPTLKDFSHPVS